MLTLYQLDRHQTESLGNRLNPVSEHTCITVMGFRIQSK